MTAVHREEGISLYRRYDNRGRLTSVKDAQGRKNAGMQIQRRRRPDYRYRPGRQPDETLGTMHWEGESSTTSGLTRNYGILMLPDVVIG